MEIMNHFIVHLVNRLLKEILDINKNNSINNETTAKNVSKRQFKIMELIKENLTQDEIADKLGVSRFTIIRDIKFLKQNGFLSRVGSNKTGFWKIN